MTPDNFNKAEGKVPSLINFTHQNDGVFVVHRYWKLTNGKSAIGIIVGVGSVATGMYGILAGGRKYLYTQLFERRHIEINQWN